MADNLNASRLRSTRASNTVEVFSPQERSRPTNEFLTDLSGDAGDYCLIRCILPAGAIVPMHSHSDRETFFVLAGTVDALREDRWQQLEPGDVFDVPDGTRHAWRNSSRAAALIICVTTVRMARFLRDISAEDGSPEQQARRFLRLVEAHGYWLASPEENAAVGLDLNWSGPRN